MRGKTSSVLAWIGSALALAIAMFAMGSPQLRQRFTSKLQQMGGAAGQGLADLASSVTARPGKQMAAIREVSTTLDQATTQYDASLVVSKVGSALCDEPRLRGQKVNVRMIGGILHLEGEVRTPEEKALASELARRASGAELVANDLRVATPAG